MPLPPDVAPLVRGFANNSFRSLFRQSENVADLVRWRKPHDRRRHDCGWVRRLLRATEERSGYRACAPRAADLQDLDHDLREVWKASEH